jgi:CheY-like chemotaxis protein
MNHSPNGGWTRVPVLGMPTPLATGASCIMTHEMMPNRMPAVLVVDDVPGVARSVAQLLRRRGIVVVVAETGSAAIAELRDRWFDGLVMDFHMPDIRGDALYARAIAIQPHLARHTVFLTGDVSDTVRDALTSTGSAVIAKPFEIAELERAVQSIILDKLEPPLL